MRSVGRCSQQRLKEAATRKLPTSVIKRCKNCEKDEAKQIWVAWPEGFHSSRSKVCPAKLFWLCDL